MKRFAYAVLFLGVAGAAAARPTLASEEPFWFCLNSSDYQTGESPILFSWHNYLAPSGKCDTGRPDA
jgi:hypothetical protein